MGFDGYGLVLVWAGLGMGLAGMGMGVARHGLVIGWVGYGLGTTWVELCMRWPLSNHVLCRPWAGLAMGSARH
jgi:hypothetical protein